MTRVILLAVLAGTVLEAAGNAEARLDRSVTVCMESVTGFQAAMRARWLASGAFAAIGVTVSWREGFRGCPAHAVMVVLTDRTPETLKPGALAYALPYEGTHVRVFYDRIRDHHGDPHAPVVLGYVLVHEITHILQGVSRHSESGIMKAQWGADDFEQMFWKRLEFSGEDIVLIYRGLEARARAMVAGLPIDAASDKP